MQAPRGEIVDRHGQPLVENRNSLSIKVTPDKLPEDLGEREEVYRRLAKLLGLNPRRLEKRVEGELKALPFSKPTVKQDVTRELVAYVLERQEEFPGVEPEREFLREYPHGPVGAHLFGQVGEVSPEQLKDERFNGVEMGDRVGQAGIEREYDRFLRGPNGAARVEVDALGNLTKTLKRRQPVQGKQLRLSLDLDVQRVAQQALAGGTGKGAFAVMNVQNGEVLALGSQPSFDPNVFTKPITKKQLDRAHLEGPRRAAPQPGDPGRLSHGLDLQAGHRDGRARERPHHAGHAAERPGLRWWSATRSSRTPAGSRTARWRCARRSPSRATCSSTSSAAT